MSVTDEFQERTGVIPELLAIAPLTRALPTSPPFPSTRIGEGEESS